MAEARTGTPGRPRDPKGRLVKALVEGSPGQNTADPDYESPQTPERQTHSRKARFNSFEASEVGHARG